jgi:hypothetical protein
MVPPVLRLLFAGISVGFAAAPALGEPAAVGDPTAAAFVAAEVAAALAAWVAACVALLLALLLFLLVLLLLPPQAASASAPRPAAPDPSARLRFNRPAERRCQ